MSTYAVGDIHGCFNEWMILKDRIEKLDKDAKFILVGDIIDRGQNTVEMVDWAMKNITQDGKYQMIMGNHEAEKIDWWRECNIDIECTDDVEQLRDSNLEVDRYLYAVNYLQADRGLLSIKNSIEWFETLPYYKDLIVNNQRFVIVHANLPFSAIEDDEITLKTELDEDTKSFMTWDRDTNEFGKIKDTILIHGHTPTIMTDAFRGRIDLKDRHFGKILNLGNRYNIDCGITYMQYNTLANLAALRLEDLQEFYVFE